MGEKLDKGILIHRISKIIIKLSRRFHIAGKDSVSELHSISLAVDAHIIQEMELMRMKERGEIK